MFESRGDLLKSLLSLTYIDDDLPVPEDQKHGILARIFGRSGTNEGSEDISDETSFPADIAEQIVSLARLGVALKHHETFTESTAPLGKSKIGGCPDLPAGMAWPLRPAWTNDASNYRADMIAPDSKWSWATPEQCESFRQMAKRMATYVENEAPLSFFAQINFADLAATGALDDLPELPRTGILYLFYDYIEQAPGFDPKDAPGNQLIYVESPEGLTRTPIPEALAEMLDEGPFRAKFLTAKPCIYTPSPWQTEIAEFDLPDPLLDAYGDWLANMYSDSLMPDHRLMGWPNIIQNPMEAQCTLVTAGKYCGNSDAYTDPNNAGIIAQADDWILLLQIDSDDAANFMLGDSGILYVWIRKQDLAARAFDKAWVIMQCC